MGGASSSLCRPSSGNLFVEAVRRACLPTERVESARAQDHAKPLSDSRQSDFPESPVVEKFNGFITVYIFINLLQFIL